MTCKIRRFLVESRLPNCSSVFPIWEEVFLRGLDMTTNFDENLCKKFLFHCPKLESFDIDVDEEDNRIDHYLRVRALLTSVDLFSIQSNECHGNNTVPYSISAFEVYKMQEYVSQHPRIFLPVLEQLSNVARLFLVLENDMQENPGERYLSTRSQEVQDQITERLSKITYLSLHAFTNIGNTLQFVSEYFTSLNQLYVERDHFERNANEEQDLFLRNLFSLISSVDTCCYNLEDMRFRSLVNNFVALIQNMFQKVPEIYKQSKSRVLEISVSNEDSVPSKLVDVNLKSQQAPFCRNLRIEIDQELTILRTVNLFKNGAPMGEVDVFVLRFSDPFLYGPSLVTTRNYLQFLETMPSLKAVKFYVPAWFDDAMPEDNQLYSGPILSLVEEATFNVSVNGTIQTLLDSCCSAFPNLKLLTINGFSGMWNASVGEFQLFLQDYSLELLTIDIGPVKRKVEQLLNITDAFFVLEMEIQSLGVKCMYSMLTNLSCEVIDAHELRNFRRRKDYLSVRIIVNSLKLLKLFWKGSGRRKSRIIMLDDNE